MNPLSITASIIAVLQATNAVISVCYDYSAALKGAPWELSKVMDELKGLRGVLENLAKVTKAAADANPASQSRLPTLKLLCDSTSGSGPLISCLDEINRIKTKLSSSSWSGKDGSKRQALMQVLGWPLKEQDTRRSVETIGRLKSILTLALTSDQASTLLAVQNTVENTAKTSLDIHRRFQSKEIYENREEIYEWLSSLDSSVNLNDAYKKRMAGIGSWLLRSQQYLDWKTYSNSFLWLHGIPDCGKTILSSTIVEDVLRQCLQDTRSAAAYFFFDFNDSEKQLSDRMVRSIVAQIFQQRADMSIALISLFFSSKNRRQPPTTDALLAVLQQMFQECGDIYIIFDALDECTDKLELLSVIEEIYSWKMGNLHFIVTSRQEKDIQESFDSLIGKDKQISIQSALVNDDIRAYVQERLKTDRQLRRWQSRSEVRQEIEDALMDKAAGMFRWAACQLDALSSCLTIPMLRKALKSLPKTLDDIYVRILCTIKVEYCSYAFKILQWLVFSVRSLSIQEAAEILAIDEEAERGFNPEYRLEDSRDILTICSSLVTIAIAKNDHNEDYEELRLAHYSVKEYLISDRVSHGFASKYDIAVELDKFIAQICLLYLFYFSEFSLSTYDMPKKFSLLDYAVNNWTMHARTVESYIKDVTQLSMELLQFEKHAFINWLSLHPHRCSSYVFVKAPLCNVAMEGLYQSTKILIDTGADVNAGEADRSALVEASSRGHTAIVQLLIDVGVDVNAGGADRSALVNASFWGHTAIVQLLIDAGANVNAGEADRPALVEASSDGHTAIVQLLINAGADVNAGGADRATLVEASKRGHDQVDGGAIYPGTDTALIKVTLNGHDSMVERSLKAGARIDNIGVRGPALRMAAIKGHGRVVEQLLKAGAQVNMKTTYGSAIKAAAEEGHLGILEQLLEAGADVNADEATSLNALPATTLEAAVMNGQFQIVERLLEAGAEVNRNTETYSRTWEYQHYIKRLLEAGAEGSSPAEPSSDALHMATVGKEYDLVLLLLKAGARVDKSSLRDHARYAELPPTTPGLTVQRLLGMDLLEKYAINRRRRKPKSWKKPKGA